MKYSRYQRSLHVEKVATIVRDDPTLSSRAVFRILNEQGLHLSRSYVNQIVGDAFSRVADEERMQRTGMYRIGDWMLKVMNLCAAIEQVRKELETTIMEYPDNINPRY
jgi:hypothetical protein